MGAGTREAPVRKNDPRVIAGWAMYDWANSAYVTTTATALLPAYFARSIVPAAGCDLLGRRYDAQTLWAYLVGVSALLIFVLAPTLGAIADFAAAKKRFLAVFACGGGIAAMLLSLVGAGDVGATMVLFLIAQTGLVGGNVFYDGFLPDIATPQTIDRVSARGYACGYLGGGLQFALACGLVVGHDLLGLTEEMAIRLSLASAGLWWLGFSALALSRLRETGQAGPLPRECHGRHRRALAYARVGFRRTWALAGVLRSFPQLTMFLIAYVLYSNGVQTVIAMTSIYATDTLRLDLSVIFITLLVVQFVAIFGALAFGALAQRLGAQRAVLVSLGLWSLVAGAAYFLEEGAAAPFFILAMAVGMVLAGTQALSRSLYGTMIPEAASAQFYGIFSVFAKLSAFLGPLLFAAVSDATGSARKAILSMIVFFVAGAVLLALVDVEGARRARLRWRFDGAADLPDDSA